MFVPRAVTCFGALAVSCCLGAASSLAGPSQSTEAEVRDPSCFDHQSLNGPTSAQCDTPTSSGDEHGTATADFGSTHLLAEASGSGDNITSTGSFLDYITVNGGSGAGTLSFSVTIDGTITGTAGTASLDLTYVGQQKNVAWTSSSADASIPVSDTISFTTPIDFGVQKQLSGEAALTVFASSSVNEDADFSDTIAIDPSSVTIRDGSGNIVTGATITSLSGTNYASVGVSEPASAALLAPWVLVVTAFRLRRWWRPAVTAPQQS